MINACLRTGSKRFQKGSATVEYFVVALCVMLALVAGPNVIRLLWSALHQAYTAFYYAISVAF